jgi:hypothetical protein
MLGSGLRIFPALMLAVAAWIGSIIPVPAQSVDMKPMQISAVTCESADSCSYEIGARFTVETLDGKHLGSCTLAGDRHASLEIAGAVSCRVLIPAGIEVVVTEDIDTITPGTVPVENPMYFTWPKMLPSYVGVIFRNEPHSGIVSASQSSDVAIVTTENGRPVYDACYELVDFSNVGCDENSDGQITFLDVPHGTYTVHQTADLGPDRSVEDFAIRVSGDLQDGWEVFHTTVINGQRGAIDISLITRDPDDGRLLTDTCYELVDYSNLGCDENGDGQVTFSAIPFGTYIVRQTRTPAGYPAVSDFEIEVLPTEYPTGFVVRQASKPNAPDTRNVSVMLIDDATNAKRPIGACVRIVDASNTGCEEDLIDGQIDFLDVPEGTHDIVVTHLPAGYAVANPEDLSIEIDANIDPANLFVYVHFKRQR